MSELSRRRAKESGTTTYCFCDSCDRVLYVDAAALFCPVCSSPVVEIGTAEEIKLPEPAEPSGSVGEGSSVREA